MEKTKPKFRLEDIEIRARRDARVYRRDYTEPDNQVARERTYCPCDEHACSCENYSCFAEV